MQVYDVVLIGTGQATGNLVSSLLDNGKSVAVVEGDRVGGSCVNWGCTPTKTLVASARAAHMARRGGDFGVRIPNFDVDFSRVHERVDAMRMPATKGFQEWLKEATDFYKGWASFVDERTVQVGDHRFQGHEIIIHTGTRARRPDFPGLDTVPWLDNKGILDLAELPEHLLIIGGSYIGLEFAQAFRRLGSEVTVVQRSDRLVTREDRDIGELVFDLLSGEGISIELEAKVERLEAVSSGVRVHYTRNGTTGSTDGSHVLVGVGRVPNSDNLNLPTAGVEVDEKGFIEVDDYTRTSVPHIYAVGDVNGRGAFTHTSVHDGQVVLDQLVGAPSGRQPRTISDRTPIHSMFVDPPIARVGMNVEEARASGANVLIATRQMSRINRAREKDETHGMVKLLVDGDRHAILGATIFGVGGDEIIGMLALAMQAGLPYTALQDTVLPHPTVSELIPWILDDLRPLDAQAE